MGRSDLGEAPGATVARLERSLLTSWPALSTSFDGDWVLRLSNGYTKRSNSVTCLGNDSSDLRQRIDRVEAVFERHGQPPIFRISPLAPPELDACLDQRGWRRFDETIVMTLDLAAASGSDAKGSIALDVTTTPDDEWLEAYRQIDGMGRQDCATLTRLLDIMVPQAGYGRVQLGDNIGALALAVVDAELIGLFEVMTAIDQRRRGLAQRLLEKLFDWGQQRGAVVSWLAVVAANLPAVSLYQRLGFREVYRYHYRMPDLCEGS